MLYRILLVHCNSMCGDVWPDQFRNILEKAGLGIVTVDLNGHGQNQPPQSLPTWETLQRDILNAVNNNGNHNDDLPWVCFAHSMGATAALSVAREANFKAMVVFEPVIGDPAHDGVRDSMVEIALKRKRTFANKEDVLKMVAKLGLGINAAERFLIHGVRPSPGGGFELCCDPRHEAALYAMGQNGTTLYGDFSRVKCPVLLLRGALSTAAFYRQSAERLKACIPGVSELIVDDATHFGPLQEDGVSFDLVVFSPIGTFSFQSHPHISGSIAAIAVQFFVSQRVLVRSASPFEKSIGFSRAVRAGDFVFVSGTAPIWPDGHVDPDPGMQARRCWTIALDALAKCGGGPQHVVRTRQYIVVGDDDGVAKAVGAVHGQVFGATLPSSTMVVVAGLLDPRWVVEVELDAVIPKL